MLFIIPARGGSKGIPGKNIKPLGGKPLIHRAIENARAFVSDADICLSTDDPKIIAAAEEVGLKVPFVRPAHLAADNCGTYEVLLHALDHYKEQGKEYDKIVLLQATSPFTRKEDIQAALDKYTPDIDMVVTVKESDANPYFNLFEASPEGYLRHCKEGSFARRQDAPKAYEYNGAAYVINPQSLRQQPISTFKRVVMSEMDALHSIDLDTPLDWLIAETLISQSLVH